MSVSHSDHESEANQSKRNKIRAVLAGGLVLGVGAAITLAAWTDTEVATGTFSSGSFGIVGQVGGTGGFTEHTTSADAAALSFTPTGDMTPGSSRYAKFDISRTSGTTVSALITSSAPTESTDPLSEHLQSEAVVIAANGACDATAFTGSPTAYDFAGPGVTIGTGNGESQTLNLCIKVSLDQSTQQNPIPQGATGTLTWTFLGTQVGAS